MKEKPETSFKIRVAYETDSQQLVNLCEQLGYQASGQEIQSRLKDILKDEEHQVLIAELPDGVIVGWVHIYIYRLFYCNLMAEIGGIVVDRDFRAGGVGKELMATAEVWAKHKRCHAISLRSNVIRKEAHLFYERVGYRNLKTQFTFRKEL